MDELRNKNVCVLGLGLSGRAACRLLLDEGARVTAVDAAENDAVSAEAAELRAAGVDARVGCGAVPEGPFDLVVASPGIPPDSPLFAGLPANARIVSELELGFHRTVCRTVAITGTNGKTTVTELIQRILEDAGWKSEAAGNIGRPLSGVAARSRGLDCVPVEVSSFQLERIESFRSTAAVLLNITPDHLDRHGSLEAYARVKARVFQNQEKFDWAIGQSEALAYLRSLGVAIPSKIVTFSAVNRRADIYQDRGLLISRLPDWSGPLLNMADCRLAGPHNMENVMAALAVGRILHIPLPEMRRSIQAFTPAAHRCELVGELDGVRFVNDSKSTNPDSLQKALEGATSGNGEPHVLLIAGGSDKGLDYHLLGPTLARRVKKAFLIGEMGGKLRASWSLFAPCELNETLDAAFDAAVEAASPGDVVLLSPGCASFDQFENYRQRGDRFRQRTERLIEAAQPAATL